MRASFQCTTICIQKLKTSTAYRDSSNLNWKSKASYKRSTECDSENTKSTNIPTRIPPMTHFCFSVNGFLRPCYSNLVLMKKVSRAKNSACMPRSTRNLVNLRIVRYTRTLV